MKGLLRLLLMMGLLYCAHATDGFSSLYNKVFGRPGCNNNCGPFSCCKPDRGCSFVNPIDFEISDFSTDMFVVFTVATAEAFKLDNGCYSWLMDGNGTSAFSRTLVFEDGSVSIKTFEANGVSENLYSAKGGGCKYDFEITAVIQDFECMMSPIYIMNRCFCSDCCKEDTMVIGLTSSSTTRESTVCVDKAMTVASEQFPCLLFRKMPYYYPNICVPPVNVLVNIPYELSSDTLVTA